MENGVKSSRQLLTRLGTKNSSLMSQSFERRTFSDAAVKFRKSRSSNVVNRKDGHRVSFRNVFWEERMRTVSKPPLWIEHLDATSQVLVGKRSSKKLTLTEKRIAATSLVTMIVAVVSFKIVFGGKAQVAEEDNDSDTPSMA